MTVPAADTPLLACLPQNYHDPITYKVFNDHTAIAAIRTTGNVYARESIDRLNLKPNNLHDVRLCGTRPCSQRYSDTSNLQLLTDEPFTRKDIITLQDPLNVEKRDRVSLGSSPSLYAQLTEYILHSVQVRLCPPRAQSRHGRGRAERDQRRGERDRARAQEARPGQGGQGSRDQGAPPASLTSRLSHR